MDIRFEVKDKRGQKHAWRIQTDRMNVTLLRFSGISEGEKTKGEERWGSASYPSTIGGACKVMIQEGMRVFPGSIREIMETTVKLEKEILKQLRIVADHKDTHAAIDLALVKVDDELRVLKDDEVLGEDDVEFHLE